MAQLQLELSINVFSRIINVFSIHFIWRGCSHGRLSSQWTASSPTSCRECRPPPNFVDGHSLTIWFMVWCWPHTQRSDEARPHLWRLKRQLPWPVRKWFSSDHDRRGRSNPGCQIAGSVTSTLLTTEADDQSSRHCSDMSAGVMSDQIGRRDVSRGGECSNTSAYDDQSWWAEMLSIQISMLTYRVRTIPQ